MSDLDKILLTAATTVLGGVTVFVVGQIVTRFLIDPLYEQRKVVGSIADALIYHAHYFADSGRPLVQELADLNAAADQFRRLASELTAKSVAIPGYRILGWIGAVRPYDKILHARSSLWGLANGIVRAADWRLKLRLASEAAQALKITAIDKGLFSRDWEAGEQ
jgi:hypothetical protein